MSVKPGGPCSSLVSFTRTGIHVIPSGGNDTATLQCAVDTAIASGRRTSITLAAGTFHSRQIVARGFVGGLHGAGKHRTIITNTDEPNGTDVTTPWTVYGIDPPIRALAHGVVILGTRAQGLLRARQPHQRALAG